MSPEVYYSRRLFQSPLILVVVAHQLPLRARNTQSGRRKTRGGAPIAAQPYLAMRVLNNTSDCPNQGSHSMRKRILAAALAAIMGLMSAVPRGTVAQEAAASAPGESGGAKLEEVLVTAQRREERLKDVPIAISVRPAPSISTALTSEVPRSMPGNMSASSMFGKAESASMVGAVP